MKYIFYSRKMAVLLILISAGVFIELKTDGLSSELRDLLIFLGSAYLAANVGSKFVGKKNIKHNDTNNIGVEVKLLKDQINKVEIEHQNYNGHISAITGNVETINAVLTKIIEKIGGKV